MYAHAQFDAIWAEAYRRLTVRISAATSKQRAHAAYHVRHSMQINYDYLRHMFETQPELVLICKCCGTIETATFNKETKERMLASQLCFGCDLWSRKGSHHPNGMVIDGAVFTDGGNKPPNTPFLGHGGAIWHYRAIGDEEVKTTNNLWHGGVVPEEFLDLYPNTHELVKVQP